MTHSHEITAIVEGLQITGFQSGNIESSLITPADAWILRLPASEDAWREVRRDARIVIKADGVTLLTGFVDKRHYSARDRVMEFSGRDVVGRLCDESAPAISYDGMTILEAVRRLASPWFDSGSVVLSDARNRRVRRGKGRRVASGTEPVVTFNVRVPKRGRVHPGEDRWHVIHEILSRAGLLGYASGDGKELIIGKPNQSQAPQYLFRQIAPGSQNQNTVRDMDITEDDGDRYSLYLCAGMGGQRDTNYGSNVTDNRGVAFDNPFNTLDGTGRDFLRPKRMFLPERAFEDYADAQRVADNEKARRDYKRHLVTVECDGLGQDLGTGEPTLFATDTTARVIEELLGIDDKYYVVSCSYSFSRDSGDTTTMHMVPTGTEIVL